LGALEDRGGEILGQFSQFTLGGEGGGVMDAGGNLIGSAGVGSGTSAFTSATTMAGTVATPLNPLLGPLQGNGGMVVGAPGSTFTLQTELLKFGSPAIGHGILFNAALRDARDVTDLGSDYVNIGATAGSVVNPKNSKAPIGYRPL
jgi:hypothetical protein